MPGRSAALCRMWRAGLRPPGPIYGPSTWKRLGQKLLVSRVVQGFIQGSIEKQIGAIDSQTSMQTQLGPYSKDWGGAGT